MSGKWKPYPAYKPSGVDWLGEIPAQWEVKRLKYIAQVNPSKSELSGMAKDTEVTFLPMELVGNGTLTLEKTKAMEEVGSGFTYFRDLDVLVAKITPSFENGKGAIARGLTNGVGFGTTELHVIRANSDTEPEYLYYLTLAHSFRATGAALMYGTAGQKRVPESFIRDFGAPTPFLSEQRAIASFLDRETQKIDGLIAKNGRLIDLLREQRIALISHAVTKGLDPNAPMKDSGVERLGNVPVDCEVKSLGTVARLQRGHDLTVQERREGSVPVVTSSGPSGFHDTAMAKGPGVVTGRYGTIGEIYYIEQDFWPMNTTLYVCDFKGNHPRYIYYLLMILPFDAYSGKSAVPGIDRNDLHPLPIITAQS